MMRAGAARLRCDVRGVAAVEFALVVPLLLLIFFGVTELVRAIDTSRKVTIYARTIADLAGRASSDEARISGILDAAGVIMRPYGTTDVQTIINAMGVEQVSGTLMGGVCSSYARNATKRAPLTLNGTGTLPATPATFRYDGARYVLVEVSLAYTPVLGASLYRSIFGAAGIVFARQVPWAQRLDTGEVVMPNGAKCPTF
ncbi:TadE/TadG family type IV pilus assembly protein [Methylobacterium sp. J-090]|uniref:TadE/TadG family type IV pilus assembly protein n=1 Tax=Methylobacterium sp. J-090 TaxID=2836666 RepID=UPI001FB9206C|nr:TadE/TadG family type IV pilus assembly protein [Methylobacterium sp. J-090]MCJ2082708.1 pilus assembly protein [Methylobacterium sp. J-090]